MVLCCLNIVVTRFNQHSVEWDCVNQQIAVFIFELWLWWPLLSSSTEFKTWQFCKFGDIIYNISFLLRFWAFITASVVYDVQTIVERCAPWQMFVQVYTRTTVVLVLPMYATHSASDEANIHRLFCVLSLFWMSTGNCVHILQTTCKHRYVHNGILY